MNPRMSLERLVMMPEELSELDRAAAEDFINRRQSRVAFDPDERDIGDGTSLFEDVGCCGCIVMCLLIMSPPIVLIGVVLLSTGAILGSALIFALGLVVIVCAVIIGAVSAFAFVHMRSKPLPLTPSRSVNRTYSKGTQPFPSTSSARTIEPLEAQTIELTFCTSELQTGLLDKDHLSDSSQAVNHPEQTDVKYVSTYSIGECKDRDCSIKTSRTPILPGYHIS